MRAPLGIRFHDLDMEVCVPTCAGEQEGRRDDELGWVAGAVMCVCLGRPITSHVTRTEQLCHMSLGERANVLSRAAGFEGAENLIHQRPDVGRSAL